MEKAVRLRILDHLDELAMHENPLRDRDVRGLEGKFQGLYRFRVGEYRLIFQIAPAQGSIIIHAIAARGRAY